jgi:hypothetical protein
MSAYHPETDYYEQSTPVNQIIYAYASRNLLRMPRRIELFLTVVCHDVYNVSEVDSVSISRSIGRLNGDSLPRLLFYLKTEEGSVSETLQT